ncbi:MAG: hypothetical protein JW874_04705 [Spirochaetales bacterium]|nr:hypothetical protein [Spirochaetales bacterium]
MSTQDFYNSSVLAERIQLPLAIVFEEKEQNAAELSALLQKGSYRVTNPVCRLYAGNQCLGEGTIREQDGKTVFRLTAPDKTGAKGGKK